MHQSPLLKVVRSGDIELSPTYYLNIFELSIYICDNYYKPVATLNLAHYSIFNIYITRIVISVQVQ